MDAIGTIFAIIMVIIVIVSWIRKISAAEGGSNLSEKLLKLLANQNDSEDFSEVKIYDENGNLLNTRSDDASQEVVIYDEDGNVISAALPQPVIKKKKVPEVPVKNTVVEKAENKEFETGSKAEMYHDFIRANGGSAIVIQEVMGKPLALR